MTTNDKIQILHKLYTELTGLNLPLPVSQYWIWEQFIARGHGEDELRAVVKHLKRGISNQERRTGCLRFSNLLGDMDRFAEELSMARKYRPKPAYAPGKSAALRATGRPDEPPTSPAQSVAQVLEERIKLATMLHNWRAHL